MRWVPGTGISYAIKVNKLMVIQVIKDFQQCSPNCTQWAAAVLTTGFKSKLQVHSYNCYNYTGCLKKYNSVFQLNCSIQLQKVIQKQLFKMPEKCSLDIKNSNRYWNVHFIFILWSKTKKYATLILQKYVSNEKFVDFTLPVYKVSNNKK